MPDVSYVADTVDYLVQGEGADWCVMEAHAIRGRYTSRDEAVKAAARAARQSKDIGIFARVLVNLSRQQAAY